MKSVGNVQYQVIRKQNKKRLTLKVNSEAEVLVIAPEHTSDIELEHFVSRHVKWLEEKIAYMESLPNAPEERQWKAGEYFYLFGEKLCLEIEQGSSNSVIVEGSHLKMTLKQINPKQVKKAIHEFYRLQGELTYRPLVERWCEMLNLPQDKRPKTVNMASFPVSMGTCSKERHIRFALRSLMLPLEIIDYLALHECAHLVHFNHSPAFKALLTEQMPLWRERQKELNRLHKRCSTL